MTVQVIEPQDWKPYGTSKPKIIDEKVQMKSPEPGEPLTGSVPNLGRFKLSKEIIQAQRRGENLIWGIKAHSPTAPTKVKLSVQSGRGDQNELSATVKLGSEPKKIFTEPVKVSEAKPKTWAWANDRSQVVVVDDLAVGNPKDVRNALKPFYKKPIGQIGIGAIALVGVGFVGRELNWW